MKKSTDILLRIILVVSILGAIFFYYYGKFVTSKKVIIKSQPILLPAIPEEKKKEKSKKIPEQKVTQSVSTKKYTIFISDYPILQNINKLKDYLASKNIKFKFSAKNKEAEFKRVFVGPFQNKFKLIKIENRLKKLGFEPLWIKLRGAYFLHCGSFYYKEKADELKNKLIKSGIRDIVIFKYKKPIPVYDLKIDNLDNKTFNEIKNILDKNNIKYSVAEKVYKKP